MPITANFDKQSLRGFLQMVETDYPEELLRVDSLWTRDST